MSELCVSHLGFEAILQYSSRSSLKLLSDFTTDNSHSTKIQYHKYGDHNSQRYNFSIHHLSSIFAEFANDSELLCLVNENTPYHKATNSLFPLGITYATSATSLKTNFEIIDVNTDSEIKTFSDPIACVGGSNIFGHFLIQCVPKLVAAKELGMFEDYHFIFSSKVKDNYLRLIHRLGLLPSKFSREDPNLLVNSEQFTSLPSSSILSSLAYKSHIIRQPLFFDSLAHEQGYGLSINLYQHLLEYVNACTLQNASLTMPDKVYIPRKTGTHRDIRNRSELIEIARMFGFTVIYIEDLSIEDQLCLFKSCRYLITEVGSTACNAWIMPNLRAGLELCIDEVLGAWGLTLAACISSFKFFRVDGKKIKGTQKKWDQDQNPLDSDYDFNIDKDVFKRGLTHMLSDL